MNDRSPQGFWQVDASEGHVYWGGSAYGALSVTPGSSSMSAASSAGSGPFNPWPYPTVDELLASDHFQSAYNQIGAIGWALAQPDGTVIDLPAEAICGEWNDGRTLGLREWFEPIQHGPKLLLCLDEPAVFHSPFRDMDMATIDIIGGKLTTLPDGRRAIVKPEAVYAYADNTGQWMFAFPCLKTVGRNGLGPITEDWPWKIKIAP
jgi:hypothetical protein